MEQEKKMNIANLILRLGIAAVFIYAAIGKLFLGAAPPIDKVIPFMPAATIVFLLGLAELILGVLLLIGLITRFAALGTAVLLLIFIVSGIVLDATGTIPGMFNAAGLIKDIGLLGASIHLALEGSRYLSIDKVLSK